MPFSHFLIKFIVVFIIHFELVPFLLFQPLKQLVIVFFLLELSLNQLQPCLLIIQLFLLLVVLASFFFVLLVI